MNELLKRAKELTAPADESDVQGVINRFEANNQTPSVKTLEAVLKHYKEQLKQILSKDLLQWMEDEGQVTFETEDMKVSIKTYVSAKVMDQSAGFDWLIANQYGDLIKDNLEFPKGELTNDAERMLEELGLSYIKKSGIHTQSLMKIMRDRLDAGDMLPDEDAGIKVGYYDECVLKEK